MAHPYKRAMGGPIVRKLTPSKHVPHKAAVNVNVTNINKGGGRRMPKMPRMPKMGGARPSRSIPKIGKSMPVDVGTGAIPDFGGAEVGPIPAGPVLDLPPQGFARGGRGITAKGLSRLATATSKALGGAVGFPPSPMPPVNSFANEHPELGLKRGGRKGKK